MHEMDLLKFLENQIQKKAVGTLTLGKKKCFREVFFQGTSMYLVGEHFSGRVAVSRLREMGVPGERINAEDFEAMLQEVDRTKRLLPQILHEQEVISEDELKVAAVEHLTEEITDLLFRNPGSFHFQEGRVPEYLLKCEDITGRVPVSIETVLDELRRRNEILAVFDSLVPSHEEIFVLTEKGMAARQTGTCDVLLLRVLGIIDGLRDLRSILKDTYLYELHVLGPLVKALQEGYIKKTIHPELKGLSTQTFSKEDAKKYLPLFKNAVKYGVDELAARERLAVVYEKLGRPDEAVIQYNYIGDSLYQMRTAAKAIKAYQKALVLKPGELLLTEKITRIYSEAAAEELSSGNNAQAIQLLEGALRIRPDDRDIFAQVMHLLLKEKKLEELSDLCDWICALARKTRVPDTALHACLEILRELPQNAAFRKKLINLHLDFGMAAEASAEMQTLARQYLERGQKAKAQELIEKIRRVGAAGNEARQLERQVTALAGREGRRRMPRLFLSFVLCFCIYQVWTYFAWVRLLEGPSTADAAKHGQPPSGSYLPGAEEERCLVLAASAKRFLHEFPLSVLRGDAERLLARVLKRANEIGSARAQRIRTVLRQAREKGMEGEKATTESLLRPLMSLPAGDDFRREAEDILEEVKGQERSAAEVYAEGKNLEGHGDFRGAYRSFRRLLDAYPDSSLVKELKLPVVIDSAPSGADVYEIVGEGQKNPLGRTPHAVYLSPGGTLELELSTPGYVPLRAQVHEPDGAQELHLLQRRHEWTLALDGQLEGKPSLSRGWFLCGTSLGTLIVVEATTGKVLATQRGDPLRTLVAHPVLTDDGLFTLWNNGRLIAAPALPASPGAVSTPVAVDPTAELFLGSLATSPLHAPARSRLLLVGTKTGQLQAYTRAPPALEWSLPLAESAETIMDIDDDLLVTTRNGWLLRVRMDPPSIVWRRQVSPAGIDHAIRSGKSICAATRRNDLILLRADSGDIVHTLSLPPGARIFVSEEDGRVFTVDTEGTLARIDLETGEAARTQTVPAAFDSVAALKGCLALLPADRKGFILLDSDTLEILWGARATRAISNLAADERWVVIVTDDGKVTAYPRS